MRPSRWLPDAGALLVLLLLPLVLFGPVTAGSRTLLPADNLYQWEPYRTFAPDLGVDLPPHNELLSDLVLENMVWKQFIVESLRAGQLPLWNPHLFAGVPFLAAGQHSALYPLSAIFYVLPLARAYGLFTVLQLWLAGAAMYALVRVLRLGRWGALVAGIVYQLSAFFLVSVVFTMILAAAAWLPLLLAVIEIMMQRQEEKGAGPFVPIVYVVLGAVALGVHVLAGHPEILVYTLLVVAYYALVRLIMLWRRVGAWQPAARLGVWLGVMVALGLALGSVQLVPLFELVTQNFREGSVTYADVTGWAFPTRQIVTFLVPDFFGNPSHHGYWDLVAREWVALDRAAGTHWGIKNYVEAGSYVGILPLLLALVALLPARWPWARGQRTSTPVPPAAAQPDRRPVWIFGALALASLLFVFGTPLYALLYYGLPGINQLHSPFRWVWPYTVSVAVLAGMGTGRLGNWGIGKLGNRVSSIGNPISDTRLLLGWAAIWVGGVLLVALGVAFVAPQAFLPVAEQLLGVFDSAQAVFGTAQAFLSYQWRNLIYFALMLIASGIVLRISRCPIYLRLPNPSGRASGRSRTVYGHLPIWKPLAVLVVAVDLLIFGAGFNPSANPDLLDFVPPSVEFLQEQMYRDAGAAGRGPWRLTTYQPEGSTRTLNANIPWRHGLYDVRGYDSIIPAQYATYMRAVEGQGELLYNRIAPIYGRDNLSSPLLDLLGVRYVATEGEIPNDDYRLVYEGELNIYQNVDAMPRAFALPTTAVEWVEPATVAEHLSTFDPRRTILLDGTTAGPNTEYPTSERDYPLHPARIATYSANTVFVDVEMLAAGWLVLTDSYFPGWKAYASPLMEGAGMPGPGDEPENETELQIVRADGNFRAVYLAEGAHRVRFKYTPMSLKLGLYGSFLAGVVLLLLGLYWLWGRFYRERDDDSAVRRVAKNSLVMLGLQLLNRLIDFVFAMMMLRILEPELAGRYQFAIVFIGYFDILVRFGLGTLVTREVAKDRAHQNRYFSTATILRGILWLTSLPLMSAGILVYAFLGQMTTDIVAAVAFFAGGMIFSNLADSFSAVFYAYEKMEYPAAISTVTALTRVSLGVLVLLIGWGFVGLAAVSVVANVVSAGVLGTLMLRHCFRPRLVWDAGTGRWMMAESFPLMINHFLAIAFFRIDTLLLKPFHGDTAVGYYGAAYKYVEGLGVIPAYFTQAVFPLMSRYAASARDSLMRAYLLSLRLLLIVALPIAVGTFFIADGLILVLGGAQYLPDSQIALQLVIWFLPFGFVNSVTQYVLIAIDQQRFLTRAFLIGVTFNIAANLVAIPLFSYRGAAVVTVFSELALLVPFYYAVRKHLGRVPWLSLFWQPALASAVMGGVLWGVHGRVPWPLLIPVGGAVYLVALALVGGFRQPDMDLLRGLLPGRLRGKVAAR
ncbi:MAG: oligosaccharide flippase family protein [Anaerolineae bacterium]|nr:oligosaccharide flippase family protein [Anaerolineae bacterium]